MNKTQLFADAQANNLKSDVTLATYLSYKMAEIKLILRNSTDESGYFRLTDKFLQILNTTLPCGKTCPLDIRTKTTKKEATLSVGFGLRSIQK